MSVTISPGAWIILPTLDREGSRDDILTEYVDRWTHVALGMVQDGRLDRGAWNPHSFNLLDYAEQLTAADFAVLTGDSLSRVEEPPDVDWTRFSMDLARANKVLSQEDALMLTRSGLDGALRRSGELGKDLLLVRLAYIRRYLGAEGLKAAVAVSADKRAVAGFFADAWRVAWARWESEYDAVMSGERVTGPALAVMREVMGMSQEQIADRLAVTSRTVRGWEKQESGYAAPGADASNAVWGLWDAWIRALPVLPSGDVAVFSGVRDPAVMRAVAVLLGAAGVRVVVDPKSLYCSAVEQSVEC